MEAAVAALAAAAAARRRDNQRVAAANAAAAATAERQTPRMRAREQVNKRKTEMLDHLLRSLDIVAYCHFAYIYFMDTSLLRFLVRSITQINMFAQRTHPSLPVQRVNVKSTVLTIAGVTIFCLILHVFGSAPFAGESSGGYLHGGLIIDFIGQETPISKYRLVLFDLMVMVLQLVMLSIKSTRQDLSDKLEARRSPPPQDHDSEERGEDRADREADEEDGLLDDDEDEEGGGGGRPPEEHATNSLYSGEIVIADLNVVETIRQQWGRAAEESSSSSNRSRNRNADVEEARQNLELRMRSLRQRWERRFGGAGQVLGTANTT